MKIFFIALSLFCCPGLWATTFAPISFEKQLREADGAIEGKFLGSSTIKNSDDEVFTQATFLVKRSVGFSQGHIANNHRLVVTYPGGLWQGINYNVPGTPKFGAGEEVFLILTKTPMGYTLNNFALGKYKVQNQAGEKILVSEVFPNEPGLGEIPYSKVEQSLYKVFKTGFDESGSDKNIHIVSNQLTPVAEKTKGTMRSPASVQEGDGKSPGMKSGFWLGLLFGVLGIVSFLYTRRQKH